MCCSVRRERWNITLEIATQSTTVKVTEAVPVLQAENGDVSTTINQMQISEVPNPGNDLTYIVQTAPGAIMNTDSSLNSLGNFAILGMPGNSYHYTLDGMTDNENGNNLHPQRRSRPCSRAESDSRSRRS